MIRFAIIIVILILALSFFGISIRTIVQSPTGQDNLAFVWTLIQNGWTTLVMWLGSLTSSVQHVIH